MKIKIIIPALPWASHRKRRAPKTGHELYIRRVIGGYISDPFKLPKKTRQQHDAWRGHIRAALKRELYADCRARTAWKDGPQPSQGWKITTAAYFENLLHCDPCNVHKCIEDVMVGRKGKGSHGLFLFREDKHMAGEFLAPQYDKERPRVEITLERKQAHA